MELATLEQLALGDRAAALATLLPGTVDHDYWRGVLLQHDGRLDEVDALLASWEDRHGRQEQRYVTLARRQLLLKMQRDLPAASEEVRRETDTRLDDRAEVVAQAQRFPTRLDPLDDRAVLADALRRRQNLDDVTDAALPDLLRDPSFDARRYRRPLLARLRRADLPRVLDLVADDLVDKNGSSGRFGALAIHSLLTLAQLHDLAARLSWLREQRSWVDAVLARLAPPSWIDVRVDRDERARLLERALAFAEPLAPAFNTLKATLLYHRLELDREAGIYDRQRFRAYLELPRVAEWVLRARVESVPQDRFVVPGNAAAGALGLSEIGDDAPLVRDYLARFLEGEDPSAFSDLLDRDWLARHWAATRLLAGASGAEAERCAKVLAAGEREALRDRVDIELAPQNPRTYGADDDVALDVDVKNVPELEVKVFRIDALAYWIARSAEVDTSIDLDGMVASGAEKKLAFDDPPIRRRRIRVELPECKVPGTYVVELIGNGRSSRALVRKGSLRHLARTTAAGTSVTITDERGAPLPAARLWLGARELTPRDPAEGGGITIPFATSGGVVAALLVHGSVVQRITIDRPYEQPVLAAGFHVERESLVANQDARLLCRPKLTLGGAPVSLALVEDARIEITASDLSGTSTSRTQPVVLRDDEDVTVDLNVPDGTIQLSLQLRGRVRVASRQETVEVADGAYGPLNVIQSTEITSSLHLARVASAPGEDRFVLSFLGKTGEPLAGRAIAIALQHRITATLLQTTLETDERGEIDLGPLAGKVMRVVATWPVGQRTFWLGAAAEVPPPAVHALEGEPIVLPRPRETRSVLDLSLMAVRQGANVGDESAHASLVDRTIAIEGLAAGDYRLDVDGATTAITVVPRAGEVHAAAHPSAAARAWVQAGEMLLELPPPLPVVRRLEADGDALVLHVANATPSTRVHFVATRFLADPVIAPSGTPPRPRAPLAFRAERATARYVSGRDIGDEYRYVLERRKAQRRPGMMLEKPSLLLHPWPLRTTSTKRQEAASGGVYAAAPPPPPGPAMRPAPSMPARAMRSIAPQRERSATEQPGFPTVDFLPASAVVLSNLRPDADGVVRVPRADLGASAQLLLAFVLDPSLPAPLHADVALPPAPLRARDLRLKLALDPARHFAEQRRIDGAPAGTPLVVPDVRSGKIELVDTLARAHQLLTTLTSDPTELRELSFVTEWAALDEATRRARYSKYACHELHLFLWKKDRAFFDAVVRPALANKREKAFVDRFLLGADLGSFLEPWAFGRLNTVERILLASAVPSLRPSLARLVGDTVDLTPPDPERDARLVATLLGAAALEEGGGELAEAAPEMAFLEERSAYDEDEAPKRKKGGRARQEGDTDRPVAIGGPGGGGADGLRSDLLERKRAAPLYRGADKTQEWAEVQWWKRRRDEIDESLIAPNRFWRDLAEHVRAGGDGPFLSPHVGDCAASFAEAMCALAFLDLPFVAAKHTTELEETRLTVVPASHALAARSSLVEIAARAKDAPPPAVLVGQSYVRSDDRWEWDGAEQREKRVAGEMIAGVVYRCLVVVTNPTSASEKLDVLMQIPKGALPVASGFLTRTVTVHLSPYGTQSLEYAFYFPLPGRFSHFPAHVTRGGALLVAAEARELEVVREPSTVDQASWSHVSQRGSLAEVLAFLEGANLGRVDLERVAWRMHDREAFTRVTELLAARRVYDDRLWAYALLHHDRGRAGEWLRHQEDFLREGGPELDGVVDPVERAWFQHLEYAPLINARAHRLGAQRRILNDGLDAQYRAFLDVVAHRAKPASDALLAAAHYLLCMDRVEDAIALLDRVRPGEIEAKLQHDYLAAYVACYRGDLAAARRLATPWATVAIDRWRSRYGALVEMLDEVEGTGAPPPEATSVDADQRDRQMTQAAARQASLDIAVRGGDITITHANLAECRVRFFKMDIELVFSRQPFVQSDVDRFSFIEPGLVLDVALTAGAATTAVPIPPSLHGANLVIEAVAPGLRRSVAHYAHDLGVQVAHAFGQLRVVRASTGASLPAVYVKVYGRERGGRVAFFKDGYTDLRGRLDYATLSTDDLDRVERFAILVASDDAGATIVEAPPPTR
ncbi:MAG: hypothetical protein KIT84_18980 [Labilithrix sp.]|nr:hypothetical protein [Labilithrix sp.]MCW5813119.1 hypothetical protein [Labilithrix sp.]